MMTKWRALELGIAALEDMHGSLTGEDEGHVSEAAECLCESGEAIRRLRTLEDEVV